MPTISLFFGLSAFVIYVTLFLGLQYTYSYFTKPRAASLHGSNGNLTNDAASAMLYDISANTGVPPVDETALTLSTAQGLVGEVKEDVASIKRDLSFVCHSSPLVAFFTLWDSRSCLSSRRISLCTSARIRKKKPLRFALPFIYS